MIRLLYISHAAPTLTIEDIRAILKTSRQHNKINDITGTLIHGGGMFMQILEGEEVPVLSLYLRIMTDKRHDKVRLVTVSPAEDRLFQSWSMGNIECEKEEFERIVEARSRTLETANVDAIANFAFSFARMLHAQMLEE